MNQNRSKNKSRKLDSILVAVIVLAATYGALPHFGNESEVETNSDSTLTDPNHAQAEAVFVSGPPSSNGNAIAAKGAHPDRKKGPKAGTSKQLISKVRNDSAPADDKSDLSDETFMETLRKKRISDPLAALKMANQGEVRFEGTDVASECAWLAVRSLVDLGQSEQAKEKTREMMDLYPTSRWTLDARRHMFYGPENRY